MSALLPMLSTMSRAEKLEALEELWQDLTREPGAIESPPWHGQALNETEQRYREGLEVPVPWEAAKERLRELRQQ